MAETQFTLTVNVEPAGAAKAAWDGVGVAGLVVKAESEQRYTLTVAYPANKADAAVAADGYKDFASKAAVEDAAWSYLTKSPVVGLWHADGTDGAGQVVESYIYRGPDWTVKAADGTEHTVTAGDWLLGIQWDQASYEDVKAGRIGGVSMQGKAARRVPSAEAVASLRS